MENINQTTKIYLQYNEARKTKIKFIRYNFGDQREFNSVITFEKIDNAKDYMEKNGFVFDFKIKDELFFTYKNKSYGFKIKEISY